MNAQACSRDRTLLSFLRLVAWMLLPVCAFKAKAQEMNVWIENLGQVMHPDNTPANEVLYYACLHDLDIYITNEGLSYVLAGKPDKEEDEEDTEGMYGLLQAVKENQVKKYIKKYNARNHHRPEVISYHRIDVTMPGAVMSKDKHYCKIADRGKLNFYTSPEAKAGILNVREFDSILIRDIYPGIDWALYFKENEKGERNFKQDFIVRPSADIKKIRLKIAGAKFSTDETATHILLHSKKRKVDLGALLCYQDHAFIPATYEIKDGYVCHSIPGYDPGKPLTIDPELTWSTYYGGRNYDGLTTTTTDAVGNIYASGYSSSTPFPLLPGRGYFSSGQTGQFLLKFNAYGKRLYATWYSGTFNDLATDKDLNLYAVGRYGDSSSLQYLAGAFNQANGSGSDALIVKFDSSGKRLWGTFFGGTSGAEIYSVAVDSNNNFFVGGITNSPDFPKVATPGAYQQNNTTAANDFDGFIAKFSPAGTLLWSTNIGTAGVDAVSTVKVDRQNQIYITGTTEKAGFPLQQKPGAYFDGNANDTKAFIMKFNSIPNSIDWSTLFGGTGIPSVGIYTFISDACFDHQNNMYLAGETEFDNLPVLPKPNAYNKAAREGAKDGFIAKFDPGNRQIWTTYFGGSGNEDRLRIGVDCDDHVYITGEITSDHSGTFPRMKGSGPGSYYNNKYGTDNDDGFVSSFSNDTIAWSTLIATNTRDFVSDVAVWGNRTVVVGEHFQGGEPVTGLNATSYMQPYSGSNGDPDECMIKMFQTLRPVAIDTINTCSFPITIYADSTNQFVSCIWDDGLVSATRVIYSPGAYAVEKINSRGCAVTESFIIVDLNDIELDLGKDTVLCKHSELVLNAENLQATYLWNTGVAFASITVKDASSYWVQVTNSNGCVRSDTILVDFTQPEINLGRDTFLCRPTTLRLDAFYPGASYVWQDGSKHPLYEVSEAGTYAVTVATGQGCSNTDTIIIEERPCDNIYIPTVFSPNNDGLNDKFRIIYNGHLHLDYLTIYDRWGNLVYFSRNISDGWDGRYKGVDCELGTYFFQLSATSYTSGNTYYRRGEIFLTR